MQAILMFFSRYPSLTKYLGIGFGILLVFSYVTHLQHKCTQLEHQYSELMRAKETTDTLLTRNDATTVKYEEGAVKLNQAQVDVSGTMMSDYQQPKKVNYHDRQSVIHARDEHLDTLYDGMYSVYINSAGDR